MSTTQQDAHAEVLTNDAEDGVTLQFTVHEQQRVCAGLLHMADSLTADAVNAKYPERMALDFAIALEYRALARRIMPAEIVKDARRVIGLRDAPENAAARDGKVIDAENPDEDVDEVAEAEAVARVRSFLDVIERGAMTMAQGVRTTSTPDECQRDGHGPVACAQCGQVWN
jgi:hypothetical protein